MNKNIWALHIGHFVIAMNEIDWMTNIIHSKILSNNISNTWIKKTLAERLKNLIDKLCDKKPQQDKLIALLKEALELCDKRNLIAHGSFALDARKPLQEGEMSQNLIHSLKHDEPATQADIQTATSQCIKLSDDISECIAIIELKGFSE